MRHYPTDVVLAVESVSRALTDPTSSAASLLVTTGLCDLFDADALAEGLDELFGGLSQFPWPPLVDSDDVDELTPVGTVVLEDTEPTATLRGVFLAWAAGNDIVVRTERRVFWHALLQLLRDTGYPLPDGTTAEVGEAVDGYPVDVPAPAVRAGVPWDVVIALDCRSAWAQGLFRREHLAGVRLSAARARDPHATGRLDAKLRYLVAQARRAPFHRDRNLPDVTGVADLVRLPIMEKDDLEAHSLPHSRDLGSGARPSGEVLRSGGSSGAPRYVVYSRTDQRNMIREAIPQYYALGLRAGDRLINTLFGGKMYGGLPTTVAELSRMPVECYTTAQLTTADDLLMLTASFDANVVLAQPAMILPLLREAKEREPGLRMPKVIYGGTPMAESDKTWLREQLGTEVISSMLAANDGAQLGYQCGELGGTLHHICDDYNLIEVVDSRGEPVPDGELGDLLITNLQKFEGALVRYRIGDCGRIRHVDCACGVSGRVLDYAGRSDGQIEIISRRVQYGDVVAALESFDVSQVQIEVASVDGKEWMTVRTESRSTLDPAAVREHLIGKIPVLGDIDDFDRDLDLFEFVVECLAEGQLGRDPVSGKIKTVVDRRLP
ncbi:phenylacetate--CoA ligase family protein [Actinokineospora sp. HUAS TT18]|uniref:phenylacetate--CoA ligase family protein n=1 Tax=Actinokineospora sp. HUAS TT18 TaxID=3447451 RepID=UPI003F51B5AF